MKTWFVHWEINIPGWADNELHHKHYGPFATKHEALMRMGFLCHGLYRIYPGVHVDEYDTEDLGNGKLKVGNMVFDSFATIFCDGSSGTSPAIRGMIVED